MEPLSLPLDCAAIECILPHRYPFLLVDRITEFEVDKRIVGIKNVSLNDRYLARRPGERPALPWKPRNVPGCERPHPAQPRRPDRPDIWEQPKTP